VIPPPGMGVSRSNACAGRLCVSLLVIVTAATTGCDDPPVPQETPKSAGSVHAAAASASAPATPPEPPEPPLTAQPFVAGVPPALCTPEKIEGGCNLDAIGSAPATDLNTVKRDRETLFVGWAADDVMVPPVVFVQLIGPKKTFWAPATRRTKRPDVAAASKAPALVNSGYDLLASLEDVDPGEYSVQVAQITSTGKALLCNTRRKVKIEKE
jgi:hypothetical protein